MANTAPTFTVSPAKVVTDLGGYDGVEAMLVQADGKILVAGPTGTSLGMVRYNANGTLDTSFNGTGKLVSALSPSLSSVALAQQADGKILLVGRASGADPATQVVMRFNTDGSADTSYGTAGRFVTNTGANNFSNGALVQADGKLVVAGGGGPVGGQDAAATRYTTAGALDTSFGGTGHVKTDLGYTGEAFVQLVQQTDGKLLGVGTTYISNEGRFALVRYNSNGTLDTSFNASGLVNTSLGFSVSAQAVALQSDGKIIVSGSTSYADMIIARYNANGSLDTTFNGTGHLATDISGIDVPGQAFALAGGKILVVGSATGGSSVAMVRYNSDGSLDTTFGGTGKVFLLAGGNVTYGPKGVAVLADGKILVSAENNGDVAVLRFNADGTADTSFGTAVNTLGNTISYFENSAATVLSAAAGIGDTELAALDNYNGATLTLARNGGANAQDVFGATGTLSFAGGNVTQGGTVIGTVVQAGGSATLTFNSAATQTLLNQALKLIGYSNTSDLPPASVVINWSFSDGNTGGQGTGGALTAVGTTTVNITEQNDPTTGSVTVGGTYTQGQQLTASNTLADLDGLGTLAYQWQRNGADIASANGTTYTLTQDDVGKSIRVRVTTTDGGGRAVGVNSTDSGAVANVNDLPTGDVTIGGTVAQGQTLTASNTLADLDGGIPGAISYQWLLDGAVTGVSGASYTLAQADVGKAISVRASYTDGTGVAESKTSAATTVANVNDLPTGGVTISGTATQGQTLTAANTLADADGIPGAIGYQWLRDGADIGGATGSTYALVQADVGKAISVRATYTDGFGAVETPVSSATAAVANVNDLPIGSVTISGTSTQGQTLTASSTLADADGIPGAVSYQWLRDGALIGGATGSTYALVQADVGKAISVRASYTDGFGFAESPVSAATAAVANINDAPTGSVAITGTAAQNQTLTASNTLADADGIPGAIGYQWLRDGAAIGGATGVSYALVQADVGKTISVRATYTDGLGAVETPVSAGTATVANVNDAPTGAVTFSGSAVEGQTLTAANTIADPDGIPGAIGYQWLRDGAVIGGATAGTYVLTAADIGHSVKVRASYTDGGGASESLDAAPVTVSAAPAPPPPAPAPITVAPGAPGVEDTATLTGDRSQYTIARDAQGNFTLKRAGDSAAVTLQSVERLQFGDKSVNLTVGDAARSITAAELDSLIELYVAYVNRVPDADGMAFWIGQYKAGNTLAQIGESFYSAATQYASLTGYSPGMSNEAFVGLVYRNALGRSDPDAEGLAFWSQALASGAASRGTLVASMLNSAHTFKGDASYGYVANLLDNKIAVGKQFAITQGLVYNTPQDSISKGMEIAAAVTSTSTDAAVSLIGVNDGLVL